MILTVDGITKSFGEKLVLKGVSFSAESGKALGLLGRNGAGKTTLIRIIMGIFPADSGAVYMDSGPISESRVKIGYLPEERGLYPKKRINEQLLYFASLRGMDKKSAQSRIDALFDRLEVTQHKNARLETLSKGNQQKIQLAAALITDPQLIILDEPFSGLDPVNAALLKDLVKELIGKGKTVLFSSHQMNYIEEFCDEIVILNGGKSVLNGKIRDIKTANSGNIMEIRTPDAARLENLLNTAGFVSNAECKEDLLTVELSEQGAQRELLGLLYSENARIEEFKIKEPTLNEIFVRYTEGQV